MGGSSTQAGPVLPRTKEKTRERGAPKIGAGSLSDDAEHGREEHPRGTDSLSDDAPRNENTVNNKTPGMRKHHKVGRAQ